MNKRVFISFSIEDKSLRDLLVGQAHNSLSPFEFTDMSVKEPWKNSWKTSCRSKIRGCLGMIAIITTNTKKAEGELWEIDCAQQEQIPILYIWGSSNHSIYDVPNEVPSYKIKNWSWNNISKWINKL